MKLIYAITPAVDGEKRAELLRRTGECLAGATLSVDETGTRLSVLLTEPADAAQILSSLQFSILPLGINLREIYCEHPVGATVLAAPVERPHRTVQLSTFLISLIAAVLSVAVIAFTAGSGCALLFATPGGTLGNSGEETAEDYVDKISLIDEIFKQFSIYDVDGQLLLDEMLKAYANATGDAYAAYYTEEEFRELMETNSGNMVGIGVTVIESTDPAGILIVSVLKDSPAMQAGVQPGDLIISLGAGEEEVEVAEKGYEACLNLLRGEIGTVASFTVLRDGESFHFEVTRAAVKAVTASGFVSETDPSVGVVQLLQFDLETPTQFKATMEELIGKGCTKFVFDVRNNPGGDLKSVSAILSLFLNEGDLVVSISGRSGEAEYQYVEAVDYDGEYAGCSVKKEEIGCYRQYAMAVLTNGYSASAAELFTSVLRDYELATIVGETTYGKGILQSVFDLSYYGYKGGFKLTTGYYTPPCGINYHEVGITPHIVVAPEGVAAEKNLYLLTEAEDNQLQAALQALKQ